MMTVIETCSMLVFNDHYLVNHSAGLNTHTHSIDVGRGTLGHSGSTGATMARHLSWHKQQLPVGLNLRSSWSWSIDEPRLLVKITTNQ